MFTARCVPNMYLFGTFSAQNGAESRPSFALLGQRGGAGQTAPRFKRYVAPPRAGWRNMANPQPA
jgi:hypothetical protein